MKQVLFFKVAILFAVFVFAEGSTGRSKPGACPPPLEEFCSGSGHTACTDDQDCPDDQKCCTGCEEPKCMAPAREPYVTLGCPLPPAAHTLQCSAGEADNQCVNDSDCTGRKSKCCYNYCGFFECVRPSRPRGGECPTFPIDLCRNGSDVIECGVDRDCEKRLKCCPTSCDGLQCTPRCKDNRKWRGTVVTEELSCTQCSCKKLSGMGVLLDVGCINNDDNIRSGCCQSCKNYALFKRK